MNMENDMFSRHNTKRTRNFYKKMLQMKKGDFTSVEVEKFEKNVAKYLDDKVYLGFS